MSTELVERLRKGGVRYHTYAGPVYAGPTAIEREAADELTALAAKVAEAEQRIAALMSERSSLIATKAEQLAALTKRATAAEAKVALLTEALEWSMDEVDVLSNKLSGFAYPQGMAPAIRRDQLDSYCKAVAARRALSEPDKEGML